MFIDIFLIIALFVVFVLYLDAKKKLKQNQSQGENRPSLTPVQSQASEFSLGLTRLNSDFSEEVSRDALTGLPGKEALIDRLNQTIYQSRRYEKSFGVMLLDIQNLTAFNEKYGHTIGDKLLAAVATRLKGVIRQIDTVSRYAGGSFIFLLPQLALPETAAYVAQRLLDSFVQPFHIDNQNYTITAGVGVSIFPIDGTDETSLIRTAADALKQAKKKWEKSLPFLSTRITCVRSSRVIVNHILFK